MKLLRRAALLAMLAAALMVSAGAAITHYDVTKLDVRYEIDAYGDYTAVLTAFLAFDGADTALTLPLGPNVTSADAVGFDTALSRADGIYYLTLTSRESFVVPGTYTVSWQGTLPFTEDEETGTSAELPLLCAQWPGGVAGVTFTVTLPAAVSDGAGTLLSGYYGELTGDGVTFRTDGAVISGALDTALLDHESLTLALALPREYFTVPSPVASFFSPWRLVVPVLTLLAVAYWLFRLRSPRTRCRTQLLPPDGVCAGDVPFVLHGTRPDLALTVVQWASLGYLTIRPTSRGAVLVRTMGMGNERKGYEARLFRALFASGTVVHGGAALRRARDQVERPLAQHWRRRLYDRKSGNPALLRLIAECACAVAAGRAGYAIDQLAMPHVTLALLLAAAGLAAGIVVARGTMAAARRARLWMLPAALCALALLLLGGLTGVRVAALLAVACAVFSGVQTAHGGRRTRQGSDMLARLRSLRAFLSGADEMTLRRLTAQDPQYYYRMLPFAEALGVGRAFAARFGQLRLEPCGYYPARAETTTAAAFYEEFSLVLASLE